MDKKYLGSTVPLPKEVSARLDKLRERLKAELGFEPSRSDAVAYLMTFYEKTKQNDAVVRKP